MVQHFSESAAEHPLHIALISCLCVLASLLAPDVKTSAYTWWTWLGFALSPSFHRSQGLLKVLKMLRNDKWHALFQYFVVWSPEHSLQVSWVPADGNCRTVVPGSKMTLEWWDLSSGSQEQEGSSQLKLIGSMLRYPCLFPKGYNDSSQTVCSVSVWI